MKKCSNRSDSNSVFIIQFNVHTNAHKRLIGKCIVWKKVWFFKKWTHKGNSNENFLSSWFKFSLLGWMNVRSFRYHDQGVALHQLFWWSMNCPLKKEPFIFYPPTKQTGRVKIIIIRDRYKINCLETHHCPYGYGVACALLFNGF